MSYFSAVAPGTRTLARGIFSSPKSYMLETVGEGTIMKHKGAAKSYVDPAPIGMIRSTNLLIVIFVSSR